MTRLTTHTMKSLGFLSKAALVVLFMLITCTRLHASDSAVLEMNVEKPTSVGYRIGDVLPITVKLQLADDWFLDPDTLPAIRRVNRWLELISVGIDKSVISQARSLTVDFRFLIVGNPEKLSALVVPPIYFDLIKEDESWPVVVEPMSYTLSPILTHEARNLGQMPELRPGEPPYLVDTDRRLWRIFIFVVLLVFGTGYLLYLIYGPDLIHLYNRPFAKAVRKLSIISRMTTSDSDYKEALKVIHNALQETYGSVVMTEDLDEFLKAFPVFSDCRKALQAVYDSSNAEFFDYGGATSNRLGIEDDLLPLCRICRRLERRI